MIDDYDYYFDNQKQLDYAITKWYIYQFLNWYRQVLE